MRRSVFYDAEAPAASAAATMLADEFDVRPLVGGARPAATPAVVILDGETGRLDPLEHVHVIALVAPQARGPWPPHWYALLPHGVGAPLLARAVANAFADLGASAEIRRLGHELSELNAIGIRLSAERNPDALLELILSTAREITESDAGSLYLVEEGADGEPRLFFALTQNDTITVPFQATRLPLDSASIAGHVALTGKTVSLEDAYQLPPGSPFHINRTFDEQTGYRTRSMLVVPMRTPHGDTIGVLQLINCKPGGHVRAYGPLHESLAESLASQAAVAVDNNRLYQSIRLLFEGFVGAAVTAIESRDPTTSGHSFRVAELTVALADVVDRCAQGRYAATHFAVDEIREIRYAALLHDFGKVGVREHVLLKAKKLYPAELDRIRGRLALVKRGLELRVARLKLDHLLRRGRRSYAREAARLDAELAARLAELDASLERIVIANEPTVVPEAILAQIERMAQQVIEDGQGAGGPLLTPEEAVSLAIPRGSLTEEEILEIRSHVVHTFQFLTQIPWTKELRRVPEIARSHHEKLDGSGYPHGAMGDAIPVQSRMMTIADIYDALTAADRPYKRAVPVAEALAILDAERRSGALDGDLLDLFLTARLYERTSPRQQR
ncbi:MAG TPA: HD domain-containing phosphohydrolase [Methylomirabilota bacterium]|jgi:HD-GYP domain-containing protein (c-di-GMP phosphodiesterase class II)